MEILLLFSIRKVLCLAQPGFSSRILVAGSIATATHGSGIGNGNLATQVEALTFINANGQLMSLSKIDGRIEFFASVVGLGALGVVTSITLRIQPTFNVAQHVFEFLPVEELKNHFEEIMSEDPV